MGLSKYLIIISISILSCPLYSFNSTITRQMMQSTPDWVARCSALPKFVATSMYAHKYVSAVAIFAGAMLVYRPTRRAFTGFLHNLFVPNEQNSWVQNNAHLAQRARVLPCSNHNAVVRKSRDLVAEEVEQDPTERLHFLAQIQVSAALHNSEGQTILHRAADCGQLDIVQAQIDSGANIDAQDNTHQTPLHKAAIRGHAAIIQILVQAGADARIRDNNSKTPLHYAAELGHGDAVKALINAKAGIDQPDNHGKKPLLLAVQNGHEKVVRLLIQAGANVFSSDDNCERTFDYALKLNTVDIARFIMESASIDINGIKINSYYLEDAVNGEQEGAVRNLIALGIDVNKQFIYREAALHIASACGNTAITNMLLQAHANVHIVNSDGQTPLHSSSRVWESTNISPAYRCWSKDKCAG